MGLFDWFRDKRAKATEAPAAPAASDARGEAGVIVPEGHVVRTLRPSAQPALGRCEGGMLVANLGAASDDSIAEVEGLFAEVEAALDEDTKPTHLSTGAGKLSMLFAPAEPEVEVVPRALVWIADPNNLAAWLDDPRRLAALLRRLHRLRSARKPPVLQWFYLTKSAGPNARLLAGLLEGFGISVRLPGEESAVLAEVTRPDGRTISVLAGDRMFKAPTGEHAFLKAIQQAKDEAEAQRDEARLREIEQREKTQLAQLVHGTDEKREVEPVVRAPRLRQLLLAADEPGGKKALLEELRHRDIPFILLAGPRGELGTRDWGQGPALAAYPDLVSANQAAADLDLQKGSYQIACVSPRDLATIAVHNDAGVALNVYRDPATPLYTQLTLEDVRPLAKKKTPQN